MIFNDVFLMNVFNDKSLRCHYISAKIFSKPLCFSFTFIYVQKTFICSLQSLQIGYYVVGSMSSTYKLDNIVRRGSRFSLTSQK